MSRTEREIPREHHLLGQRVLARDPEAARPGTFVHVTTRCELLVLTVLGEHDTEARRVLERATHQPGVLHSSPVVGEQAHAKRGQLGHRDQPLATPADRDRTSDCDLGQGCLTEREHVAGNGCRVDGRLGVRHGDDSGVATKGGGPGPGLDRFGYFPSRLAQVSVQVDKTGRHNTTSRVQDGRAARCLDHLLDGDNAAVPHEDVTSPLARLVHQRPAADDDLAHL